MLISKGNADEVAADILSKANDCSFFVILQKNSRKYNKYSLGFLLRLPKKYLANLQPRLNQCFPMKFFI